jgi:hypothetical protein
MAVEDHRTDHERDTYPHLVPYTGGPRKPRPDAQGDMSRYRSGDQQRFDSGDLRQLGHGHRRQLAGRRWVARRRSCPTVIDTGPLPTNRRSHGVFPNSNRSATPPPTSHSLRHHAEGVQCPDQRENTAPAHRSVGGLESDDSAVRRGHPDRASRSGPSAADTRPAATAAPAPPARRDSCSSTCQPGPHLRKACSSIPRRRR